MELRRARSIAEKLADDLRLMCDRLEIAGSIRRGKKEVNDIEFVAIPKIEPNVIRDMFGTAITPQIQVDLLAFRLDALLDSDRWAWQKDTKTKRWGPKYKRLFNEKENIACDLFITDARHWGVIYLIRTGPWIFSRDLVTIVLEKGWHVTGGLIHGHPLIGKPCSLGDKCSLIIETPEEIDVFDALDLAFVKPGDRHLARRLSG